MSTADNPGVVVLPPLLYLGAIVLALACRWFWPLRIVDGPIALWAGLEFVALGLVIMIWGRRTMTAAGTNVNPGLPSTAIVTSGPFRFSRNPLYVGMTLFFVGLTLAFNTCWGLIVLVPVLMIMHFGVVLREERYLENKFGETYRQYSSKVRRYL